MAAFIKSETGISAAIEDGASDEFEIFVNDKIIHSRIETGSFGNPDEIVKKIKAIQAKSTEKPDQEKAE